jgi:hypothetical protein
MGPVDVQLLMHALPSGCDDPGVPQHTCPPGQSPPKHVTAFAPVHVARLVHDKLGAIIGAVRMAQHTWGAAQWSC